MKTPGKRSDEKDHIKYRLTIKIERESKSGATSHEYFESLLDEAIRTILGEAAPSYEVDTYDGISGKSSLLICGKKNVQLIWAALSFYGRAKTVDRGLRRINLSRFDMVAWYIVVVPVLVVAVLLGMVLALYFSIPSMRPLHLEKKHALVTGGSKGIGRELAKSLLKRGCDVTIMARNKEDLKVAHEELQKYADKLGKSQRVQWFSIDLTSNYEKIVEVFAEAENELGPVDILINNAGFSSQAAFEDLPIETFEQQFRVNYLSAVYATRAVISSMKKRCSGHISFVSSAAGQCGIYGYTAYAPTKFAIRGFSEVLHMELLPYKISVSVLYPPNTDTEGFKKELLEMPEELRIISDTAGLSSPQEVAEQHVNDIVAGEYTTTIGFEGWMLGALTAGASPEKNTFKAVLQCVFAGLLRFVMLLYVGYFNNICKKCFTSRRVNERENE